MNSWHSRIAHFLEVKKQQQSYRVRQVADNNQHCLNFASNDYLGLANSTQLIQAWQKGAELYGVGSGGSTHVTGYHLPLQQLEIRLAQWLGYERAIVYGSGFSANQAIIQALIQKNDQIIADKLSHASLVEAAMNSLGSFKRFAHNDIDSLTFRLKEITPEIHNALIVTEGVFSMDGDEAPLGQIAAQIADVSSAWLMVDDAHGIGVNGDSGKGTCDQYGIQPDILVVTFGKALGVSGAAILCSEAVAEYLIQSSRALIYSTAIPAAQAYALLTAIDLVQKADRERAHLKALIAYVKEELRSMDIKTDSDSAIQPIIIGDNQKCMDVAKVLKAHDIWAVAIRPPTVPPNSARIRLTLNASHTQKDIDQLMGALRHALCR